MKDQKNVETLEVTKSSFISEFAYDGFNYNLFVKFKNGKVFSYTQVQPQIFNILKEKVKSGDSVGTFYSKYIKNIYKSSVL